MKIVAHRGASADAPENTLAAFRLAWEQGADGIELDIRQTRDGRIAVIHDEDTLRTTGTASLVRERSFEELRGLDAGAWKGDRWRGERIPELREVLSALPRGGMALIEIKSGGGMVPELVRTVRFSGISCEQAGFVGFDREVMRRVRKSFPLCPVFWNVELTDGADLERLIRAAKQAGLDGLGPGVRGPGDDAALLRIRESGMKQFVWTVDDPVRAARLRDLGVEYLATNRPGRIRDHLLGAYPETYDAP